LGDVASFFWTYKSLDLVLLRYLRISTC